MLGMVINVGSQETAISIYHSGQYMTSPQSENIFMWEFTDQQGNILYQDTIVDQSTIAFGHNWSLTDTINVTVHFVNEKLDAGKIILKKFFYVEKEDNVSSLKKKTQNLEYNAFSEAIIRVVK